MFIELNQKKFHKKFETEEQCRKYLYELKWSKGYCCKRCGYKQFWKGRTEFHARCFNCDYDESVTANTVFHKIKIPLPKAFSILFHVTTLKKGVSCRNLSEIVGVGLKAVWLFKRKIQKTMGTCVSAEYSEILQSRRCSVDGIILTHRGKQLNGLQQVNLTIHKIASRPGKKLIKFRCSETLGSSFDPCTLVAGRYVNAGKNLLMWNFKAWLTGTHHHCSRKYLQGYLDEYCFRTNYPKKEDRIWEHLICSMISLNPINTD